jgi:hypothetical protein
VPHIVRARTHLVKRFEGRPRSVPPASNGRILASRVRAAYPSSVRARLILLSVAAISLTAAGAACSSSSPNPAFLGDEGNSHPPPPGGAGGDDGAGDTGLTADGAACPSVENEGSTITVENVGDTVPAAIGGTITTGNYLLTAQNYYTGIGGNAGPTGELVQEEVSITDTSMVFSLATGDLEAGIIDDSTINSGAYVAAGTSLTYEQDCPLAMTTTLSYSIDGNTLHIFSGQIESIYTAQ